MARPSVGRKEFSSLREQVFERDRYQCLNPLCRRKDQLTVDHVIKRSQGGPDTMENLATLCQRDHMLKEEGVLVLLPNGDGTFRFVDTRKAVHCESCVAKIEAGGRVQIGTGAGGKRWVIVGRPADGRPA